MNPISIPPEVSAPSGIVLPGDEPLEVEESGDGLFVVKNAYQREVDYFTKYTPVYAKPVAMKNQLIVTCAEGDQVIDLKQAVAMGRLIVNTPDGVRVFDLNQGVSREMVAPASPGIKSAENAAKSDW